MKAYKLTKESVLEELAQAFDFYSIEDLNNMLDFIRKNEQGLKKVVFDKKENSLKVSR